jgi:hypothetical protein
MTHGLKPKNCIADFGDGLRAGQRQAMSDVVCRGDTFHALMDLTDAVFSLEKRAYDAMSKHAKLLHKKSKQQKRARRAESSKVNSLRAKAACAANAEVGAIALADDVAVLTRWLRFDVFGVTGLPYADRVALYDFILRELQEREPLATNLLAPVCSLLKNHRDSLLAFALQLDVDLTDLARQFQVPLATVRALFELQGLDPRQPRRWQQEAVLRRQLGGRCFFLLSKAVRALAAWVVRASSIVENINSRLRCYFFLRRRLGTGYLSLLQFFLNHRRFLRSKRPERQGKSPAELLTGQPHPHWLEMLGCKPLQIA